MLFRRQGIFYFRQRVPDDMTSLIGRCELKKSLRTTNKKEARAAASALKYKTEAVYLRARTGMLSDRELEKLAGELIGEFTGRMADHKTNRKDALAWLLSDNTLLPTVDTDTVELSLKTPKTSADVEALVSWYSTKIEALQKEISTECYSRATRSAVKQIVERKELAVKLPPAEWFFEPGYTPPPHYDAEFNEYYAAEDEKGSPEEESKWEEQELEAWYQPPPPEFGKLCITMLQAQIDAFSAELERVQGRLHTPLQQRVTARIEAAKPLPRLQDLWEAYRSTKLARGNWDERTDERMSGLYRQIVDILDNTELVELAQEERAIFLSAMLQKYPASKEKKRAFKGKPFHPSMADHVAFKPLTVTSINKAIDLASSLFIYALENRPRWGVEFNPFAKSQLPETKAPHEQRSEYKPADLQAFVEALKRERSPLEPEKFWVPLLGPFTGAHQNELCGLRTDNVMVEDGIPYLLIPHRPELYQKTKAKKNRTIPLHPVLIDLGFLDFVAKQKHERLWPNLQLYKEKWQHEFSKWYNRTFRDRMIEAGGAKRDFHGLRHTFLNEFKQTLQLTFDNAKVLKSIAGHLDNFDKTIVGAIEDDMTFDRYGKPFKLQKQKDLIDRLDYGIDFSVLKRKW